MINSTSNKQVKRVVNLQAKAKARRGRGRLCGRRTADVPGIYTKRRRGSLCYAVL